MDRKLDNIKEIQIESMKKSDMSHQKTQDMMAATAAEQAKKLDFALSSIMANANAGGRPIITYSEPAKARILASKAEQEQARFKAKYPAIMDYNRFVQVIHDSSFCLVGEQSADLLFDLSQHLYTFPLRYSHHQLH